MQQQSINNLWHLWSHAERDSQGSMLVTGTGFHGPERAQVKALTETLGAVYSGELVRGSTTVLVVPDSWSSGAELSEKCRKVVIWLECMHACRKDAQQRRCRIPSTMSRQAEQWGTPPIVRKQWLLDSAAAGKPLPYSAFLVLTADHQPEPSASDQRCGRVSCSSKLTSCHAAEPAVSTARARSCSSPPRTSAPVEPSVAAPPSTAAIRKTDAACDAVRTEPAERLGARDADAADEWPSEPEQRRAAITAPSASAFGLDDLQPLYSPGARLTMIAMS